MSSFFLLCAFVASCVRGDFFGGIDLEKSDFVDVTKPPYSADNTGHTDATAALQAAVIGAHNEFKVVFIPHGTYLVTKNISCIVHNKFYVPVNNTWTCRFWPNVIMGAKATKGPDGYPIRPTLRLKDYAGHSGNVLEFYEGYYKNYGGGDVNLNQLLRGVNIVIGKGNPNANGVDMTAAQGSSVQDVTVFVDSGRAGIIGGTGSGGSHANVRIVGGRIGLDYSYLPLNVPTTHAFRLEGQTETAILLAGAGYNEGAVFVGGYIAPASTQVPVMTVLGGGQFGQGLFIDSIIEYPATGADSCVAFNSPEKALMFSNTFMKNCKALTNLKCLGNALSSSTNEWHLEDVSLSNQYGYGSEPFEAPVYLQGVKQNTTGTGCYIHLVASRTAGSGTPSTDPTKQHNWDEYSWPTADTREDATNKFFNVKSFGATGDASTDDAAAIQKAFDAAAAFAKTAGMTAIIRLPKGFYRLSRTVTLNSVIEGTIALLGTSRTVSILMPTTDFGEDDMSRGPQPLLHITKGNGQVVLTEFIMVVWEHSAEAWALQWENENTNSWYRQNYPYRTTECLYGFPHPNPMPVRDPTIPCKPSSQMTHPLMVFSGSGRFSNVENEDFLYEAPSYRHLHLKDAHDIHFYQLNLEHASSEANLEITNSHGVHIYGFKTEPSWQSIMSTKTNAPNLLSAAVAIWMRNTSDLSLFGTGGNGVAMLPNLTLPHGFAQFPPTLYRLQSSCPVKMYNVMDQFYWNSNFIFVYNEFNGSVALTSVGDRPSFYAQFC